MNYSTVWQNEILMPEIKDEGEELILNTQKSDLQLVELVLTGDEDAFEQIFERYKRLVATIASRYFLCPQQIDEIIQISFVKIYFEIRNFRGNHKFSLTRWIGRITSNTCLDVLRNQQRKPENLIGELSNAEVELLLTDSFGNTRNAEKSLVERDLAEKLLSQIKTEDRAILQMLHSEEMSISEVAEVTGWSTSKIKSRASRARKALRKVLRKLL